MKVRRVQFENRSHYVVPATLLQVGVFRGSQGALFYAADELRRTADQWNGRPVVVLHPGDGRSAAMPETFERQRVGTVFNAKFAREKLLAELWLDIERLYQVDASLIDRIEKQMLTEVSTGLYTENKVVSGKWAGQRFDAIVRRIMPDHLALLPGRQGACSIADGCGMFAAAS